jgi:hypothetical protein
MSKKVYLIEEVELNEIIEYLAKRPYAEVYQGIQKLTSLEILTPENCDKDIVEEK